MQFIEKKLYHLVFELITIKNKLIFEANKRDQMRSSKRKAIEKGPKRSKTLPKLFTAFDWKKSETLMSCFESSNVLGYNYNKHVSIHVIQQYIM